jgi:hypothetical protein
MEGLLGQDLKGLKDGCGSFRYEMGVSHDEMHSIYR